MSSNRKKTLLSPMIHTIEVIFGNDWPSHSAIAAKKMQEQKTTKHFTLIARSTQYRLLDVHKAAGYRQALDKCDWRKTNARVRHK